MGAMACKRLIRPDKIIVVPRAVACGRAGYSIPRGVAIPRAVACGSAGYSIPCAVAWGSND